MNEDRAITLLNACRNLLNKQKESFYVLNLLTETVFYDGSDCDGYCLSDDIEDYLMEYEALLLESVVEQIVDTQPTLTPPNEPLTCEGCMYIDEYFGPCAHCMRARGYVDRYRRLPEGEAK